MNNKKAFTIIELLVIMGVIVIFTSFFFVDYGRDSNTFALERVSSKMAQDLRRAQEMSMSGLTGDVGTNAYGIYFNKGSGSERQYIIYRNNDTNMYYESSSADSIKETINFEKGVKICDILIDSGSVSSVSISFQPPDPINYIDSYYSGHEASIVLCAENDATKTRRVKVNNTGRIETINP